MSEVPASQVSGGAAAEIAALLSERDPKKRSRDGLYSADLEPRLLWFCATRNRAGTMRIALLLVAGFMVAIALDELVPAAKSFQSEHVPILGVISGAVMMALSLLLLQ